jgi:MFS family permease
MVILVGLGEKMAERFLPVYLTALGGGTMAVGLLGGMDNLLSALYSLPGAWLAERLGARRSLLIFNAVAMAGFAVVILVPRWEAVIAASALFLSWTAISLPATMGLVAEVLPKDKRTMGVSIHSLVRRVPMALGPLLGGFLIDSMGEEAGIRAAFAAALALAGLAAVLQQSLIRPDSPVRTPGPGPMRLVGAMSPELRTLLVSDILVRFCEQVPYAFVVLWCMKVTGAVDGLGFGVLTTIEMVTAMLVYIPVAWLADRGRKKPFVAVTFLFFTAFPLALMHSAGFTALAFAFVLRGLKEFGEPTRKALIMDLSPEGRKAGMFGAYYLVRDVVVSLAAFGGAFLWAVSPRLNLLVASAFGLAGTIWFLWRGRDLPRAS